MLTLRRSERLRAGIFATCRYLTASHVQPAKTAVAHSTADEYTEEPQYPEIRDLSYRARKQQETADWHEQLRQVPTVEEKLIKINMPRYYGYKVVQLGDSKLPYNVLPATQHYTRTVLEELKTKSAVQTEQAEQSMEQPSSGTQQLDSFVKSAKGEVQDALEYVHDYFSHKYVDSDIKLEPMQRERVWSQLVIEQVHRVLVNVLADDCPHLQEIEVDYNPRHEAFWFVGGIDASRNVVKSKEGRAWQKDMAKDSTDRIMQYSGTPYLAVRHRHQLPTWKNESEVTNSELAKQIPRYNYDPRTLGYSTEHRHGTNIPGHWPGSASGFGCISYQSRAHMQVRPASASPFDVNDHQEVLHAQGIQSSYAWLLAQANYNGFNTFNDLTYPMNTQTIITNGRDWSFYEYQLNTLLLHAHHVDENPRVNFCRGSAELQLYQEIDAAGRCIGLNEQVLQHLVQFYVNSPSLQREAAQLQPYLPNPALKNIADYTDADQRIFLERTFKHMTSNRPRHLALPEIYMWEKIYKIDNKTRQLEAKRRFFALDINPWKRTLDQHQKEYIPRVVRPEGPKSRKKWKKSYYP